MDSPAPTSSPQPSKKRLTGRAKAFIAGVTILLVAIIIILVVYSRHNTNRNQAHTATTPIEKPELISHAALQCVPRGHDYYRTNSTFIVTATQPETLLVGVEYKGVYRSTDGGATWQQSNKGIRGYAQEAHTTKKCIQELGRTAVDPKDANHLLLTRIESPSTLTMPFGETAGLYESTDSGKSWRQIISDKMNASGSNAIAFNPQQSDTIYYGVNNMKPSFKPANPADNRLFNTTGILYKTTDAAKNWQELPTGAEEGLRALAVAIDQQNSQNLWLGTFNQGSQGQQAQTQKGILKSIDGGQTWKTYPFRHGLADMAVAPQNFKHVYAALQTMSGAPEAYYSLDGETFQRSDSYPYILIGRHDPYDATGLRMLGYAPYGAALGIYESTNGGKSWAKYAAAPKEATAQGSREFGHITISNIVWHPRDKNTIYMNGSGAMVWKSNDGGKNWTAIMSLDTIGGPNKNKAGSTKSSEADQ